MLLFFRWYVAKLNLNSLCWRLSVWNHALPVLRNGSWFFSLLQAVCFNVSIFINLSTWIYSPNNNVADALKWFLIFQGLKKFTWFRWPWHGFFISYFLFDQTSKRLYNIIFAQSVSFDCCLTVREWVYFLWNYSIAIAKTDNIDFIAKAWEKHFLQLLNVVYYLVENPNRTRNSSLLNSTKVLLEEMPLYLLIHSVRSFGKSNR